MRREISNSASELGKSALNVRDAAKGVGRAVWKLERASKVMIIGRSTDTTIVTFTRELARYLIETFRGNLTVYVEDKLQDNPYFLYKQLMELPDYSERLLFWNQEFCATSGDSIDFVITLGGDGTVLYAAWLFQHSQVPPVIPFHLGSLGFLTAFDPTEIHSVLEQTVGCKGTGKRVNLRMRLCCTIFRKASKGSSTNLLNSSPTTDDPEPRLGTCKVTESFHILNDLVIDRGPSAYMSLLELFVEDKHLTSVQADGLVIATPTGTGGSLVHPEVPSFLLTPICAHSLSFRPMLLPDSIELKIQVPRDSRSTAWVSFDGRHRTELKQGDYMSVQLSRWPMPTVCVEDQSDDWFNSLKKCLHWNQRTRQKGFHDDSHVDIPTSLEKEPLDLSSLAHSLFDTDATPNGITLN